MPIVPERLRRPHPAARGRDLGLLLLFVVLLQFGYPVTLYGDLWTGLYMLLYAGMVFFGLLAVRDERQRVVYVLPLGAIFVVFGVWYSFAQHDVAATLGMLASSAAFMFALMVSLMRFVFLRNERAGLELVVAAVCVFLILGGFFAATFSILEIAQPGSFEDPQTPGRSPHWQQMIYFSYGALATLGYGEFVPVTPWARSLATFETVSGTLFLFVVVARFVGVWTNARPPQR
ncbi:MAG: potassium channel family protein [Stackebrandtia sp.]